MKTVATSSSMVTTTERNLRRSPITTASLISGCSLSPDSSGLGATFLPPAVMMMSFLRPVMCRNPSASNSPRSPEYSQPSLIASAVASGSL